MVLVEIYRQSLGFPGGLDGKEFSCSVGDLGSIPGLGRSTGGRKSEVSWNAKLGGP